MTCSKQGDGHEDSLGGWQRLRLGDSFLLKVPGPQRSVNPVWKSDCLGP